MAHEAEIITADLAEHTDNLSERDLGNQFSQLLLLRKRQLRPVERHVIVRERDTSEDTIWGRFLWGSSSWDGTYSTSYANSRVVHPNRTYVDSLYSDLFKDTATTTATWTGSGQIGFTNSQVAQSLSIYLNNETVSSATLRATDGGSVSYLMSADGGSNFETVTSGTAHSFSSLGTDLRWKATASDTTSISYVEVSY
jgi:hypothetical protein